MKNIFWGNKRLSTLKKNNKNKSRAILLFPMKPLSLLDDF